MEQTVSDGFVKEVAKYFMSFLESDFKKGRLPRRNTNNTSKGGLVVGFDLNKYPSLQKEVFSVINKSGSGGQLVLKRDKHIASIPFQLLKSIQQQIQLLRTLDVENYFDQVEDEALANQDQAKKHYEIFFDEVTDRAKVLLREFFISPFLTRTYDSLAYTLLKDENRKFQIEEDLTDRLYSTVESGINEYLFSVGHNLKEITHFFDPAEILQDFKSSLNDYFIAVGIKDAYDDLNDLIDTNKLIDKSQVYLYLYEIGYEKNRFPIFYVPLTIERKEEEIVVTFDNRLFLNNKALEFAVSENNNQTKQQKTLTNEFERIYFCDGSEQVKNITKQVISRLVDFFSITHALDFSKPDFQQVKDLYLSISNKVYFYISDSSDESLINDYEEIIMGSSELFVEFDQLLKKFIQENPESVIAEVEQVWDKFDIPKKLIFASPVPLNEEQKQILLAIKQDKNKFMIIEGPPGTGKSHTITAIVCQSIIDGKSVLVLSDKKEALDVVEDKITETLNSIRLEDMQNPILRLGRQGNKFSAIVQSASIEKIKHYHRAFQKNKIEHDQKQSEISNNLEADLQKDIKHFSNIQMEEIFRYFGIIDKFNDIDLFGDEQVLPHRERLIEVKNAIHLLRRQKHLKIKAEWLGEIESGDLVTFRDLVIEVKNIFGRFAGYSRKTADDAVRLSVKEKSKLEISLLGLMNNEKHFSQNSEFMSRLFGIPELANSTPNELLENLKRINKNIKIIAEIKKFIAYSKIDPTLVKQFHLRQDANSSIDEIIDFIRKYSQDLESVRLPLFGFLFSYEKRRKISIEFNAMFDQYPIDLGETKAKKLEQVVDVYKNLQLQLRRLGMKDTDHAHLLLSCAFESTNSINKITNVMSSFATSLMAYSEVFGDEKIKDIEHYLSLSTNINNLDDLKRLRTWLNTNLSFDVIHNPLDWDLEELNNSSAKFLQMLSDARDLSRSIQLVFSLGENQPKIARAIKLDYEDKFLFEYSSELEKYSSEFLIEYFDFLELEKKLTKQLGYLEKNNFVDDIQSLQKLLTMKMTDVIDASIIDYYENYSNDLHTLKGIIRKKSKFPKEQFTNLKKAFPCIISGIRDYGEYIPLEKDLFDIIIIDEASQVSIAQALPAFIRGKKIIAMGDEKQFSNVKSHNASKTINNSLKTKVVDSYGNNSLQKDKVQEYFDIGTSVLRFIRFIRNYEMRLKKHFRCYPEIISYSDKFFYQNSLECMKIRGVPIEEVIKFDVIPHDGKSDIIKNTNSQEVDFIINLLEHMYQVDFNQSIGIISPHTDQVRYLYERIQNLKFRDWLFNERKLKIMTFDTCQGEERDYIIYSMVATAYEDKLNWIFPVNFANIGDEDDGTLKSQRLNVGFSRAKNCIHFVLSKDPQLFKGEIKNALLHYQTQLELADNNSGKTDPNSPMESDVYLWIRNTPFFKQSIGHIELHPQFPIGDYLRQLDKNYQHPSYKVDFLLITPSHKLIIEYDGFKEHFINTNDQITDTNFTYYMKDEDIYRQKVLESYGYKFIRLNKFNLHPDPVVRINDYLHEAVKKKTLLNL